MAGEIAAGHHQLLHHVHLLFLCSVPALLILFLGCVSQQGCGATSLNGDSVGPFPGVRQDYDGSGVWTPLKVVTRIQRRSDGSAVSVEHVSTSRAALARVTTRPAEIGGDRGEVPRRDAGCWIPGRVVVLLNPCLPSWDTNGRMWLCWEEMIQRHHSGCLGGPWITATTNSRVGAILTSAVGPVLEVRAGDMTGAAKAAITQVMGILPRVWTGDSAFGLGPEGWGLNKGA